MWDINRQEMMELLRTRWRVILPAVCLVLTSLFVPPVLGFGAEDAPSVEKFRVGQDDGKTRIVMQFSRNFKETINYRWFTLPEPARVVVDFNEIAFTQDPASLQLPGGSVVKGMRAGLFRPGTMRMVLDLQKAARVSVFSIPPSAERGPRLVIDAAYPKAGQTPTNVPPPADVVDTGNAPAAKKADQPAPVVPRQVVQRKQGKVVVVLDAGHGGVDPGAISRRLGLKEKKVNLDMAQRVRDILEDEGGFKVVMTRDRDVFIPLPERVAIAQRAEADLFVSFHADSHPKPSVKGSSVYMVSERASDREAQRLADDENSSDLLAGVALSHESAEVQSILISLVQRATMNNSAYLGRSVLGQMAGVTRVREPDIMFAGFRVLKAPDVPSILIEMGYLTNPEEERLLNNESFRRTLARAIAKGIKAYVKENIHNQ